MLDDRQSIIFSIKIIGFGAVGIDGMILPSHGIVFITGGDAVAFDGGKAAEFVIIIVDIVAARGDQARSKMSRFFIVYLGIKASLIFTK